MNYLTQYQSILSNEVNPTLMESYSLKMSNLNTPPLLAAPMLGVGFDSVYAQETYTNSFRLDVVMELIGSPQATTVGMKDTVISFDISPETGGNNIGIYSYIFGETGLLTSVGLQNTTLRGRNGNDAITIEAGVFANPAANSLAIGVDNSFVTGNAGNDIIDIRAVGSASLAARNSRIFGGAGNDIISLTSNSNDGVAVRDSFVWGRTGDDDVLINGSVQYSQQFLRGANKMGKGIVGDVGFDTLRLPYLTTAEFLSMVTVHGPAASNEFSLSNSEGVKYSGWDRLVCANNEVLDLTQLVG
jgi:hypothetical protein